MKATYTIVIENGHRIVREFSKREAITAVVEALFGSDKAQEFNNWVDTTIADGTFRADGFYIHKIRA